MVRCCWWPGHPGRLLGWLTLTVAGAAFGAVSDAPPLDLELQDPWYARPSSLIALIVIAVVVFAAVAFFIMGRRMAAQRAEGMPEEAATEARSSKFEPLLAEVQGLLLRVKGGEIRGYSHKIEQLVRALMERLGHKGARHMTDEELRGAIEKGQIASTQAGTVLEIFDRCRQQSAEDGLNFPAADLLRELQRIIKEIEGESIPRE